MVKVMRAKPVHLKKMVELGQKFWEQTAYFTDHGVAYDADHITKMTRHLMDTGIVQVAFDEDKVVGLLLIVLFPNPFNPKCLNATELAYYVDPEYRESGVGRQLLTQGENVAKQIGVQLFNMIHLNSVSPEKAEAVYAKMGYRKNETVFTKDLR